MAQPEAYIVKVPAYASLLIALAVAAFAVILTLPPSAARGAITAEEIEALFAPANQATEEVVAAAEAFGPDSAEVRRELGELAEVFRESEIAATELDAESSDEFQYRDLLVEGYDGAARTAELAASGAITPGEWQRRTERQAQRFDAAVAALAEGALVAPDEGSGRSWWQDLIRKWWFWVFVAPEAALLAIWLIALPFLGGATLIEKLRRR